MQLRIRHETHYDYSAPLEYALQTLCLTPGASEHQHVVEWALQVPGTLYAQRDAFGNQAHTWSLSGRLWRGTVRAQGVVETHGVATLQDAPGCPSPHIYLRPTPLTQPDVALAALGREALAGRGADPAALLGLADEVFRRVAYRAGETDVRTTAAQALAMGAGVCQDQAHVYLAACRAAGLPARYVSGYFFAQDAPDLASHAWVDVCTDMIAARWLSIDITHRCLMDERHVRLAVGPDYAACPPIRGVRAGGGDEGMHVHVAIERAPAPA